MKRTVLLLTVSLLAALSMAAGGNVEKKDTLKYYEASEFEMLGKVYKDSLPVYSRIPQFLKPTTRKAVWNLGQNTAGIAIRFRSNASSITLKWVNAFNNAMGHMTPTGIRGLDLYCYMKGKWRFVNAARPTSPKESKWDVIANMKPEEREYMLYLPLYDGLKSLKIGVDSASYVAMPKKDVPKRKHPIVFYGSSIMQGGCASRPGMAGTNILGRMFNTEIFNFGFSGNAFIDYEVAHMMAEVDASVYVLDYVPNASPEQIMEKTEKFVEILRNKRPDVPLVFVEDPIFPHSYFDQKMVEEISGKNKAMNKVFKKMKSEGVKNIYLVKGEEITVADAEGTVDGIHSTDVSFRQYADVLYPLLKKLIDEK